MISFPVSRESLRCAAAGFARDSQGGATIWNVTWLLVFAGFAGLAIDSSNGWRTKTMLQSTADVAALAGAMSLPDIELEAPYDPSGYPDAFDSAEEFASKNLAQTPEEVAASATNAVYGNYIDSDQGDVQVGRWDFKNRLFTAGGEPVNAVRVFTYLYEDERGNGVGTALLHMVGMDTWDITTAATAARGYPVCLYEQSVISREDLFVRAGAEIKGEACLHGQLAVRVQPGALWENPEALSTGRNPEDVVGTWNVNGPQYLVNPDGTQGENIYDQMQDPNRQDLYPPLVDQIVEIGWSMMAGVVGYRHFSYPQTLALHEASPVQTVVALPNQFSTVTGTLPPTDGAQTLWRTDEDIQIASLDGFASVAALLGLGASGAGGSTTTMDYHGTYQYGGVDQSGNSYNFNWPANTGEIKLNGIMSTTEGAPTSSTATLTEEKIYFADRCHSGKMILDGHIKNVTIVTNCSIDIAGSAIIENAVLLTTNTGQQAVQISNGAQIGTHCDDWGRVRIYSNGDIKVVSGSTADSKFYGTQLVAREQIHFSAQTDMSKGISLLSGGPIDITAQAKIGAFDSSSMDQSDCPVTGGVTFEFDWYAQRTSLVQ